MNVGHNIISFRFTGDNNAARRAFSENIISNIFAIKEEVDKCSALANEVIDNLLEPLIRRKEPRFVISDDVVLTYTGINGGVGAVCRTLKNAFTCKQINCSSIKNIIS